MACVINLRQRALLLVIRASTLSQPTLLRSSTQTRRIHGQEPSSNDDFSISFGPRVDDLLKATRRRKGRISLGGTTKTSTSTKVSKKANTQLKNLDKLVIEQSPLSNTAHRSGSQDITEVETLSSENLERTPSSKPSQQHSQHEDDMTIEVSGDAYETISTARTPHSTRTRPAATRIERAKNGTSQSERGLQGQTTDAPLAQSTEDSTPAWKPPKREPWQIQKDALIRKFGETGWSPRKKLSPDAMDGIRGLHEQEPERYTTEILSQQFKVSPEAIRRILKAKWRPSPEKMEERRERWARRHDRIWDQKAELGLRPARFRDRAPEGPEAFEDEVRAKQLLGHM